MKKYLLLIVVFTAGICGCGKDRHPYPSRYQQADVDTSFVLQASFNNQPVAKFYFHQLIYNYYTGNPDISVSVVAQNISQYNIDSLVAFIQTYKAVAKIQENLETSLMFPVINLAPGKYSDTVMLNMTDAVILTATNVSVDVLKLELGGNKLTNPFASDYQGVFTGYNATDSVQNNISGIITAAGEIKMELYGAQQYRLMHGFINTNGDVVSDSLFDINFNFQQLVFSNNDSLPTRLTGNALNILLYTPQGYPALTKLYIQANQLNQ